MSKTQFEKSQGSGCQSIKHQEPLETKDRPPKMITGQGKKPQSPKCANSNMTLSALQI
jgi:hypothetical protein